MQATDPADLWASYCARRNLALAEALTAVAEHAAFARVLAREALAAGNWALAVTLEAEARDGERQAADLLAMLDDLGLDSDGTAT